MKFRWIKLANCLLGILGISACQDCPVMYGCPHADIEANGKVVDKDGKPIPGIVLADGADTSKLDGSFNVKYEGMVSTYAEINVKDVDGEANGGRFEDKVVEFPITQVKEGNGWYQGAFISTEDVTIVLEKAAMKTPKNSL